MSYQASEALQRAVYQTLSSDAELQSDLEGKIFDAPPEDGEFDNFILIGGESAVDRSSVGAHAARHDFLVTVHSRDAGFSKAKKTAGRVCDLLVDAAPDLERGCVTALRFRSAKTQRGQSAERRKIVLTFRAFIDDI